MRLRFAPSPTGMLHVGNARAGLFNWLHARRHGATFVLRIEDTDEARSKPEWTEGILDAMRWLGMDWDEGPYFQTDNRHLHAEAGERLYAQGDAYYCGCTKADVEARTGDPNKGYDNYCRDKKLEPAEGRALRFRVPDGKTVVTDLVRGEVTFANGSIEDFTVVRSNGLPLYLLANVVDDVSQNITDIVRGEDHLPNTPKQMMLWKALGDTPAPEYAHLPLLVNESGKKLSKRRDKVAIEQFRDEGYLPEAMSNYMALLGWAPRGDSEIAPLQQMISEFDLTDVQPSPARFDYKKLDHFNGDYIRRLSVSEFVERCRPFLDKATDELWDASAFDSTVFAAVAELAQSRIVRLDEIASMVQFLFVDEVALDSDAAGAVKNDAQVAVLHAAQERYAGCDWNAEALHAVTGEIGESNGLKLGKAQAPIRVAVTGKKVGLPLFESLEVLGRDRTLARLQRFSESLQSG